MRIDSENDLMWGALPHRWSKSSLDWVNPRQKNRTEAQSPYGYSEYFLWRDPELVDSHRGTHSAWRAEGVQAVYSDRLSQWDGDNFKSACEMVQPQRRMRYWSEADATAFLTAYFGKPTTAVALAEGCNVGSGYPYWIFWFRHDT
jgi:hypothetical protein